MRVIICDIDGTLTQKSDESAMFCLGATHSRDDILRIMDPVRIARLEPNVEVIEIVKKFHHDGNIVVLLTGRWEYLEDITMAWLAEHGVPYHGIVMRPVDHWTRRAVEYKEQAFYKIVADLSHMVTANTEFKHIWIDDDHEIITLAEKLGCHGMKI